MTAAIERRQPTVKDAARIETDGRIASRVVESMVLRGDISALNPEERARFYLQMCESLDLSASSQPFAVLKLNGKEVLYPTRGATDQLAANHRLNREIVDGPKVIDVAGTKMVYAMCRATHPNGRIETAVATVPATDLVNALMKCETKAKRRATLSILGLGMLDETEIETIPASAKSDAAPLHVNVTAGEKAERRPAKLSDEEKAARVAAILSDYDKAISAGENADASYETAKRAGRDAGVATLVQKALDDRARAEAERKRAEYDAQQAVYSRLVNELGSAETSAAVIAVWIDNRADVQSLPEQHRRQAWSETVSRWSAVGGEGKAQGLRDALNERGES